MVQLTDIEYARDGLLSCTELSTIVYIKGGPVGI